MAPAPPLSLTAGEAGVCAAGLPPLVEAAAAAAAGAVRGGGGSRRTQGALTRKRWVGVGISVIMGAGMKPPPPPQGNYVAARVAAAVASSAVPAPLSSPE